MSDPLSDQDIGRAFEATLGMRPRRADVLVIRMLGAEPEQVGEYIWDHWMGEPEKPSLEQVQDRVREATGGE